MRRYIIHTGPMDTLAVTHICSNIIIYTVHTYIQYVPEEHSKNDKSIVTTFELTETGVSSLCESFITTLSKIA